MSRRTLLMLAFAALVLTLPSSASARSAPVQDRILLQTGAGASAAAMLLQHGAASKLIPSGLYSPRTQTMYVTTTTQDQMHTSLRAIATTSGKTRYTITLPGKFTTDPAMYAFVTMSYNGQWLALRSVTSGAQSTEIVVLDARTLHVVAQPHLTGQFGLDALNPTGTLLYLIESLPQRGPESYQVRSYDVQKGALDATPVLEKGETTGTMSGVAQTRVWGSGGDWLYTLYVRPGTAGAFIHSLGIEYRLAHCIFLPDTGIPAEQLAQYTLAIAPNGNTLYAVNPVLGRVFASRAENSSSLPFGTLSSALLKVQAPSQQTPSSAAVSRNEDRLFVATSRGVWVIKTRTLTLRSTYLPGQAASSVAVSHDGQRLYVLQPARHRLAVLAATTGALLTSMVVPVTASSIQQVLR